MADKVETIHGQAVVPHEHRHRRHVAGQGERAIVLVANNNVPAQQGLAQDQFKSQNLRITAENDNKFSLWQAAKKFLSGVISPITSIFRHPIKALCIIGAGVAVATLVPLAIPLLIVGGIAFGAYEITNGVVKAVRLAREGKLDEAENAFHDIGTGTSSILLSLIGVRGGAQIALEAKAASSVLRNGDSLSSAIKASTEVSLKARSMTRFEALRENLSLITTREGLSTTFYNLTPRSIATNFRFARARLQNYKEAGQERKRFAGLKDEQILQEAKKIMHEASKELNIPEECLPELESTTRVIGTGVNGGFNASSHKMRLVMRAIRRGEMTLEEIIYHELAHAQRNIFIRMNLSDSEIKAIIAKTIKTGGVKSAIFKDTSLEEATQAYFDNIIIPEYRTKSWPKITPTEQDKVLAAKHLVESIEVADANNKVNPMFQIMEALQKYKEEAEQIERLYRTLKSEKSKDLFKLGELIFKTLKLLGKATRDAMKSDKYDKLGYLASHEEQFAYSVGHQRVLRSINTALEKLGQNITDPVQLVKYQQLLRQKLSMERLICLHEKVAKLHDLETKLAANPANPSIIQEIKLLERELWEITLTRLSLRRTPTPFYFNPVLLPRVQESA